MTVETKKPPFWRRILRRTPERAAWQEDNGWQHHDLLSSQLATPEARRLFRSNADMQAVYGAVFAAIRKRVRAINKPRFGLMRQAGNDVIEVTNHPALEAMARMNGQLTWGQGLGLIEQHKMAAGKAFWVKRRDGLGVVREFEVWQPEQVRPVRDPKRSWVAIAWERHLEDGRRERVDAKDVIWFPHLIDPRDSLNALSPIGAIRVQLDTGMEAQRFNQKFFDNSTHIGQMFSAADAGPAEIARLEMELDRKFKTTDKAWRAAVFGGEIKALETAVSHKDMEFLEQQRWTVDEVARVFEIGVSLMGGGQRTFENVQHDLRDFWEMMVEEAQSVCDSLNSFFVKPEFGDEFSLTITADNIPALQPDRKMQADVDAIYLDKGVIVIDEIREREGLDAVPWGAVPLISRTIAPLGSQSESQPEPKLPRARSLTSIEDDMETAWDKRLGRELEAIIRHLRAADRRAIDIGDVDSYDWDWWAKYGDAVMSEITVAFEAALAEAGFVETPLLSAKMLAKRYARERAGEMLSGKGRFSVTSTTKNAVKELVTDTIEKGDSLQTLAKRLREDHAFSRDRAMMIARTETAEALSEGSMKSYMSQGYEAKRWLTARDDRVCQVCRTGASDGWIRIADTFSNGHDRTPGHPGCRCKTEGSLEMPRAVPSNGHHRIKRVVWDDNGRISQIIEEVQP